MLGELESEVLEHLWKVGAADAKEVHYALGRGRGITLNTVQSAMKRLFEKELLSREKVSHAHVYSTRVSKEALGKVVLGGVVERFLAGEAAVMIAAFVDLADDAGDEHLDQLERLVAERRRRRAEGERR